MRDELVMELSLSNQQIGSLIGGEREVVSRSLTKLSKRGFVIFHRRTAIIPDEAKLARFIDSNRASRAVRAAAS
jgi:CRP-like cAMP-binding protein